MPSRTVSSAAIIKCRWRKPLNYLASTNCAHHHVFFLFSFSFVIDQGGWCDVDLVFSEIKSLTYLLYIASRVSTVRLMTPGSKNSACHKAAFYFQSGVVVCSGHKTGLLGEHRWPKMVYTNQTKRLQWSPFPIGLSFARKRTNRSWAKFMIMCILWIPAAQGKLLQGCRTVAMHAHDMQAAF